MFQSLSSEGLNEDFPLMKKIWKMGVPTKVAIFCWFVLWGKVNTHDFMQMRNPQLVISPGWCYMCKNNNEDIIIFSFIVRWRQSYGLFCWISWVCHGFQAKGLMTSFIWFLVLVWLKDGDLLLVWQFSLLSGVFGCNGTKEVSKGRKTELKLFGITLIVKLLYGCFQG